MSRAAEGPLRSDRCTLSGGPCHWQDTVRAVHDIWVEAREAFTAALGKQSLQTVLDTDDQLRAFAPAAELATGSGSDAAPQPRPST